MENGDELLPHSNACALYPQVQWGLWKCTVQTNARSCAVSFILGHLVWFVNKDYQCREDLLDQLVLAEVFSDGQGHSAQPRPGDKLDDGIKREKKQKWRKREKEAKMKDTNKEDKRPAAGHVTHHAPGVCGRVVTLCTSACHVKMWYNTWPIWMNDLVQRVMLC